MRYFCHHCHTHIPADELLPDFTCPSCQSGFVEEMPSLPAGRSRTNSGAGAANRTGSDDGVSGFLSTRMSSDEFSDDNSDVEFLDAVNGPLAEVFSLFQPPTQTQSGGSGAGNNATAGQSSDGNTSTSGQQPNRLVTRSLSRMGPRNSGQLRPAAPFSHTNQSLADVLQDFIAGASLVGGQQFPEGPASAASGSAGNGGNIASANRGLINIDFPLPLFLHSNPGDYAWGNAGFDAVITQLLNNLDGSNTGPPPMPKSQVDNLPTVKISEEQVQTTNLQCTVCMDDFQVGDSARQLPCEHFFHQDCILPWLDLHASCPICRKTFVTSTSATPHNLSASDTQSETTHVTSEQANTTRPSATSATTTTTTTTNRSNPATATSVNQPAAPGYDLTEDDCD